MVLYNCAHNYRLAVIYPLLRNHGQAVKDWSA